MGIFSALGKALSATIDVVVLPVDIAKDIIAIADPYDDVGANVTKRVGKVYDELKEACEELGE